MGRYAVQPYQNTSDLWVLIVTETLCTSKFYYIISPAPASFKMAKRGKQGRATYRVTFVAGINIDMELVGFMKGVLIASAVNSSIFSGTTSGLLWNEEDTPKSGGQLIKVMIYNTTELPDGKGSGKVAGKKLGAPTIRATLNLPDKRSSPNS